ncbi:MAG: sulfatase-like hydrolase/transferase [Clostridia bacterium]|nr:sulfatase-like hydrolase/transferase [Clostridia bacterium]
MARRPNIIFYFSDQQRWDTMGCYGQRLPVTPVLDHLAEEGTLFENAYTCQPVCGPARACVQTGLYATEVGCHKNHHILPIGMDTLARRMIAGGYETAYIGKWHLASMQGSSYRTEPVPVERRGGYEYWMVADALEATSHGYNGYVFDGDMNRHDFVGHRIDCINAYAIDYLHKYAEKETDKPFFLFVSQLDPHHQNDRNRYEGPDGSKKKWADYDVPGDLDGLEGDWKENYPDYLGQCNLLDQNIGKLIDTLDDLGLKDDTIIFYTCDHGSHFKTRNSEYKRACEDGCLHIPLIAWGGPFMGGGRKNELVSLLDMPSTILDAAGLEVPAHYRGDSLVPLAKGEAQNWKDVVYAQISEVQTARTIRTHDYKYAVRAPEFDINEPFSDVYAEDKLYDLKNDPHERNNLVNDPAYASVRDVLREKLLECMKKANEPECTIVKAAAEKE